MNSTATTAYCPSISFRLRRLIDRLYMEMSGHAEESAQLEQRFNIAIEEYGRLISGICFSYASDSAEFGDMRQDAYINIWRGLKSWRGESKMSTWIYRVVINSCISSMRSNANFFQNRESLGSIPVIADSTSEEVERVEYLHSLIGSLCAADRACILLWLDEKSYDEIAEVMGTNRNTVATRLRRIKEKLSKIAKNEK